MRSGLARRVRMKRLNEDLYTGEIVVRGGLPKIGRRLTMGWALAWASAPALEAQVGLPSGAAQIALVARVTPRAALSQVRWSSETAIQGGTKDIAVKETAVRMRLSVNTGYRLVVLGATGSATEARPGSRLWVRDADGVFQELVPGGSVTVARDHRAGFEGDREVHYRVEGSESNDAALQVLPVRYEIAINPTL